MRRLRMPKLWVGCLVGWLVLALSIAMATHVDALRAGRDSRLVMVMLERLVIDAIWVGVAAAVFAPLRRMIDRGAAARAIAGRLAVLGLALAPVFLPWAPASRTLIQGGDLAAVVEAVRNIAGITVIWGVFMYSAVSLAACVVLVSQRSRRHERASVELQARLSQAELELLRAQLEPHFLFNALNTIAGLIRIARPELATAALARLSELLRYVVEASRQDRVPLAWELEFATGYLELQQLRFGQRLQFAIRAAPASRGCDVPPLLLQPLIENAVVHGVARTGEPVMIAVDIAALAGELRVEVGNTRGDHAPRAGTTGVGLRNTRQRLERIYGGEFELAAGPDGPDRYLVTISLPWVEAA
jgi:two-component system, LytTR family, sensor kinase